MTATKTKTVDVADETPMTLKKTAASPLLRGTVSVGAVRCWVKRGIGGVRLEARRIGGRLWVTESALARFLDATSGAAE
jgi:hypothetical protein